LQTKSTNPEASTKDLIHDANALLHKMTFLKQQTPSTLFRLRLIEIGVPLALSVVSILLTLRYPLTEARCYEIKEILEKRRAGLAT
jgi:Na+/melibiose symporter-like transporter